jgi:hypothetical protein
MNLAWDADGRSVLGASVLRNEESKSIRADHRHFAGVFRYV